MTTASDRAYDQIRAMILTGELAAGDAIREEALAERCKVSRTPIRDALRRLEAEFLIRKTEAHRTLVSDWSLSDVTDGFELRAMLESYAARRAAEKMTDKTLANLRSCNAAVGAAIAKKSPDIATFLARNLEFHALILETAGSLRLTNLLSTLIEQPVIWRTAHHYSPDAFRSSYTEHNDLLCAFERRDGAWAASIMESHIRRALHAYSDAHLGSKAIEQDLA